MQRNSPEDRLTASAMGSGGASSRRRREAPKVVIKRRHAARMDDSAGRRPPGRPRSTWLRNVADDLKEFDMDLLDARATAQNRPLWTIIAKHGATLPRGARYTYYYGAKNI